MSAAVSAASPNVINAMVSFICDRSSRYAQVMALDAVKGAGFALPATGDETRVHLSRN